MFTYSNGIDMFNAVITKGVLEQLVNTFNAAADGICRKILNIKYMITMKISFFQRRIDYCCYAFFIQYFSADTICSCIESVDELFQDTMGYDSMEHVNIIAVCVYMTIVYSTLKKKEIFLISVADTICRCTEAVDELFQHTLGHECMEHYVSTIAMCAYMSIAYSALKKKIFF